ncbi:rhodanese-like domain-containing protein [uncultured Draconibacterium sp.]|uniref:rhodanese-like domain-containing protein n=1 Tax=uncultured Draconibacterium sp. TaxID=1573823 RepID=UPI0032177208
MKQLKSLGLIILFLAVVLVLLVVRLLDKDLFKQEAEQAIKQSTAGQNLITSAELKNTGDFLFVNLSTDAADPGSFENSVPIAFKHILDAENQKLFKESKSKIVLYSEDNSEATKAWVILSQMGFENVFLLQTEENGDVLKYKFQPDTKTGLE